MSVEYGMIGVIGEVVSEKIVEHEVPTPTTDGSTTDFAVAKAYVAGKLRVYRDNLFLFKDIDYTETSSTTFKMTVAPDADESLRCGYIEQ